MLYNHVRALVAAKTSVCAECAVADERFSDEETSSLVLTSGGCLRCQFQTSRSALLSCVRGLH